MMDATPFFRDSNPNGSIPPFQQGILASTETETVCYKIIGFTQVQDCLLPIIEPVPSLPPRCIRVEVSSVFQEDGFWKYAYRPLEGSQRGFTSVWSYLHYCSVV